MTVQDMDSGLKAQFDEFWRMDFEELRKLCLNSAEKAQNKELSDTQRFCARMVFQMARFVLLERALPQKNG